MHRPHETNDLLEFRLFLEVAESRPQSRHSRSRSCGTVLEDLRVQAVRLKPVDRGEVASAARPYPGPEHLHDAEVPALPAREVSTARDTARRC